MAETLLVEQAGGQDEEEMHGGEAQNIVDAAKMYASFSSWNARTHAATTALDMPAAPWETPAKAAMTGERTRPSRPVKRISIRKASSTR